jgi:hypothetical protein
MRAKKTLRGVFENSEFDQNRTIKNGSEHG